MSNGGDTIDFEKLLDSEKFSRAISEMEKRVQGFSSSTVTEVSVIGDVFEVLRERIASTADIIRQIEDAFAELTAELKKLPSGEAEFQLTLQVNSLKVAFEEQQKVFEDYAERANTAERAHTKFTDSLAKLKEDMIEKQLAGTANDDSYRKLEEEAVRLSEAINTVEEQVALLASGTAGFQTLNNILGNVQGGFSAVQGAMSLFGMESQKLISIMSTLQTLMQITNGLQKASTLIFTGMPVKIGLVTKAKMLLTTATNGLSVALGISTVAAKTLMATLTLGLSVAITAIVLAIEKFTSSQKVAVEETNKFGDSVVNSCSKPITTIEILSTAWNRLGDDLEAKEKFIESNKDKFDSLGVAVKGVADAEKLLVDNKESFIEAQILKAKAMAAAQVAAEKYKEVMVNAEKFQKPEFVGRDKYTHEKYTEESLKKRFGENVSIEELERTGEIELSIHWKPYFNNVTLPLKEADEWVKQAVEFTEQEQEIIKSFGVTSDGVVKGSITALEKSIGKLKESYKNASTDKEREDFFRQITEQEKLLSKIDLSKSSGSKEENDDTYFNGSMDAFSQELKQQLETATSLSEMLDVIDQKRKELKDDNTKEDNGKSKILDEADKEVNQKMKDETDKLLKDYSSYLDKKIKMDEKYQQEKKLLEKHLKEANSPEEKASAQAAIDNHKNAYDRGGDGEYSTLLKQYQGFEQEKLTIAREFEEKRKIASLHGNEEMIKKLNEAEKKALSSLAMNELTGSENWSKLVSDLDDMTSKKIKELKKSVEAEAMKLKVDMNDKDFKTVQDKLHEIDRELTKNNPFASLIRGIKEFGQAAEDDNSKRALKEIFEDTAASLNMVKGGFDSVTKGLQDMGVGGDEVTQQLMSDISGMVSGAADVATGIATGNPLAIIQGSIGLITSAFKVFNINDRKAERRIQEHKKSVEKLQKSYKELEEAVDEALGDDRYTTQKDAISNLKEQEELYAKMAEEEKGKKKTDAAKVEEYENQMKENGKQIKQIVKDMREDILGMNVESAAGQLGSAMIEAFAAGEDAAEAWGNKVDDIVAGIIQKMLIQKLVEQPVADIMNKHMNSWYSDNGDFLGYDAIIDSATVMGEELKGLTDQMMEGLSGLSDILLGNINIEDRQAEERIQEHAQAVEALQDAYDELEQAIDKALGEERYATQKSAIDNLKQQIEHYSRMAEEERGKIEADAEKIKEYEQAMKESSLQLEDIIQKMKEDIMGMDVSSAASDLGNAIMDAFAAGEDAAEAWGKKVDDIVSNVVRKMLIQKLVEMPVSDVMNQYMDAWVDENGNFLGFDAVIDSAGDMANDLKDISQVIMAGLNDLPDDIKKFLFGDTDANGFDNSLTGAVKGVSEETAGMIAGQMNAIRINQTEAVEAMRQQLIYLSAIAHNTSYNHHLSKLNEIASLLRGNNVVSSLRAQGLAYERI